MLALDEVVAWRDMIQKDPDAQLLSALYLVGLLLVSSVLIVYWSYSASYILSLTEQELDEGELKPLRWDRRLRDFVLQFILNHYWIAP